MVEPNEGGAAGVADAAGTAAADGAAGVPNENELVVAGA